MVANAVMVAVEAKNNALPECYCDPPAQLNVVYILTATSVICSGSFFLDERSLGVDGSGVEETGHDQLSTRSQLEEGKGFKNSQVANAMWKAIAMLCQCQKWHGAFFIIGSLRWWVNHINDKNIITFIIIHKFIALILTSIRPKAKTTS